MVCPDLSAEATDVHATLGFGSWTTQLTRRGQRFHAPGKLPAYSIGVQQQRYVCLGIWTRRRSAVEEEDGRRGVGVVTCMRGFLQLSVSIAKLSLATGTEGRAECQRMC